MRQGIAMCYIWISQLEIEFLIFQALKALAMIRLGKSEEAQHVLKEVHAEEPCEDATLQALAICYRETHRRKFTSFSLF